MNLKAFFGQLVRRRVYRATSMYIATAWLLLQVADTLRPVTQDEAQRLVNQVRAALVG